MKRSSTWEGVLLPFRPLIIAQGEVGYAYNHLQEAFFNAFVLAMNLERPDRAPFVEAQYYPYALGMWHVLQNDRLQRQLALAAFENLPTTLDIGSGTKRLRWAKKQTDALAARTRTDHLVRSICISKPLLGASSADSGFNSYRGDLKIGDGMLM